MAIKVISSWNTIIINIERVNSKLDDGMVGLLSNYIKPSPKEACKNKSFWEKLASMFKSTPDKRDNTLNKDYLLSDIYKDNYLSIGMRVFGQSGSDGNLFFLSLGDINKLNGLVYDMESKGLISNRNSKDCDFYICNENDRMSLPCSWLHLIMEEVPIDPGCDVAACSYYTIHPYNSPIELTNKNQGGISYDSKFFFEQYQRFVKEDKAQALHDMSNIQIRYINAKLWNEDIPSLDIFIKAYISKDNTIVPEKYLFVLDGSKDVQNTIQDIKAYPIQME